MQIVTGKATVAEEEAKAKEVAAATEKKSENAAAKKVKKKARKRMAENEAASTATAATASTATAATTPPPATRRSKRNMSGNVGHAAPTAPEGRTESPPPTLSPPIARRTKSRSITAYEVGASKLDQSTVCKGAGLVATRPLAKGETFLRHQRTIYRTNAAEMEKYIEFCANQSYKEAVIEIAGVHASTKMIRWLKLGTEDKRDMQRPLVGRRCARDTEAFDPITFYWANYGCSADSDPARRPNAEVGWVEDTGKGLCTLSLSATRAIRTDEEILWNYNPDLSFSFYTPTPAEEGSGGSSGGGATDADLLQVLSLVENQDEGQAGLDANNAGGWFPVDEFDSLSPTKRLRLETEDTVQQSLPDNTLGPTWEWFYTGSDGNLFIPQKGGIGDSAYFVDEQSERVGCYLVAEDGVGKCKVQLTGIGCGKRSVPFKLLQVVGS